MFLKSAARLAWEIAHPDGTAEEYRREYARLYGATQRRSTARRCWLAEHPTYFQEWEAANRSHRLRYQQEYQQNRRASDPGYRILGILRGRLGSAMRGRTKTSGTLEALLGCTIAELLAHIECQFLPGMTWENHGEWHVDHIRALVCFEDRADPAAWHYANLQPLWAEDHRAKTRIDLKIASGREQR